MENHRAFFLVECGCRYFGASTMIIWRPSSRG